MHQLPVRSPPVQEGEEEEPKGGVACKPLKTHRMHLRLLAGTNFSGEQGKERNLDTVHDC